MTVKTEFPLGLVGVHWKVRNPAPFVIPVWESGARTGSPVVAVGRTQWNVFGKGTDSTVPSISQPTPGTASSRLSGSGVGSYSLRMLTDGAQSWNAAFPRASSSSLKSSSR